MAASVRPAQFNGPGVVRAQRAPIPPRGPVPSPMGAGAGVRPTPAMGDNPGAPRPVGAPPQRPANAAPMAYPASPRPQGGPANGFDQGARPAFG
ncbi:hypothetical protein ACNJUT_22505, partial [Mycobacterium tuberculosis]